MNLISDKQVCNNAFYFEICILQTLKQMGYINEDALKSIIEIASEDYRATIILN